MNGLDFARWTAVLACAAGVLCGDTSRSIAQAPPPIEISSVESAIVDSSAQVLREIMSIPGKGIPASLLQSAEGLVIVPGMLKGGFVIGAKHGRGVVLVRDPAAGWRLPQFITVTGGQHRLAGGHSGHGPRVGVQDSKERARIAGG